MEEKVRKNEVKCVMTGFLISYKKRRGQIKGKFEEEGHFMDGQKGENEKEGLLGGSGGGIR